MILRETGMAAAMAAGLFGVDPGPAGASGLVLAPAAFSAQVGALATAGLPWLVVRAINGVDSRRAAEVGAVGGGES